MFQDKERKSNQIKQKENENKIELFQKHLRFTNCKYKSL